jgi:hypothetical protein
MECGELGKVSQLVWSIDKANPSLGGTIKNHLTKIQGKVDII